MHLSLFKLCHLLGSIKDDICFSKAVLSMCENRHYIFRRLAYFPALPPNTIRVKKNKEKVLPMRRENQNIQKLLVNIDVSNIVFFRLKKGVFLYSYSDRIRDNCNNREGQTDSTPVDIY